MLHNPAAMRKILSGPDKNCNDILTHKKHKVCCSFVKYAESRYEQDQQSMRESVSKSPTQMKKNSQHTLDRTATSHIWLVYQVQYLIN
jgi:hypothetical protein